MPDCHAFCTDLKEAKKEMLRRFELSIETEKGIGFSVPQGLELGVRVTKGFWEENKAFVADLVRKWGKPALLEMWDSRFFYFIMKYEFNFVDALDKASALTTDQIDVENAERYGITYVDSDGKEKHPLILHLSPSGSIERVIYALLEQAHLDNKAGKPAMLPVWLSPTQVRLLPVSEKHLDHCKKIAAELEKSCIRVDIDDTPESVPKKVRNAEREWIPYYIVIGDKEAGSKKFPVKIRATGKQQEMNLDSLSKELCEKTKGLPFEPLPVPKFLSQRPVFVG